MAIITNYLPQIVVDTAGMDEEVWKEYRRKGIGGSDVAAIYGQSPFCTARDLFYVKNGVIPAIDEEDNWIAKKYGHLLEDLVAEIFSYVTKMDVYKRTYLYAHPNYPFMRANVDYFVKMPDGTEAILECKTTGYNNRDKWGDDALPFNYELQVRHYMAVCNLNVAFVACLYGNSINDFKYRRIDRDLDFEEDMIAQEEHFWEKYVQSNIEPPYTESGELVLASIRRYKGYANPSLGAIHLDPSLAAVLEQYNQIRAEKLKLDRESEKLDKQLKTVIVPVIDKLGAACSGVCKKDGVEYTVTYNPTYRTGVPTGRLDELKIHHPDIYDEYVTTTESRRVSIKERSA